MPSHSRQHSPAGTKQMLNSLYYIFVIHDIRMFSNSNQDIRQYGDVCVFEYIRLMEQSIEKLTCGWYAWHDSGRLRIFSDLILSHFTDALCAVGSRRKTRAEKGSLPQSYDKKLAVSALKLATNFEDLPYYK